MKVKTVGRLGGATVMALSGYLCNRAYYLFSDNYQALNEFFKSESSPLEYKIAVGAFFGITGIATAGAGLVFIDGLVDLMKGTHHYTTAQIWKKLSRNENTKRGLDSYLQKILSLREEEFLNKTD